MWRAHTFNTDMKPNLSYFGPEGWSRPTTNAASWATTSHIPPAPHPPPSHLWFILCKWIVFFCRSLWRTSLLYRRVLGRGKYWKEENKITSAGQCKLYSDRTVKITAYSKRVDLLWVSKWIVLEFCHLVLLLVPKGEQRWARYIYKATAALWIIIEATQTVMRRTCDVYVKWHHQ